MHLCAMLNWQEKLNGRKSLGQVAAKAKSLAELHDARRGHLGQFFTPDAVVSWIWAVIQPTFATALAEQGGRVSLVDNSVGIGRMFRMANPESYTLAGCDVHSDSVEALVAAAQAGGFRCDFHSVGMETVRLGHYSAALINPPFSLPLESPHMERLAVASHGKFGPHTACVSHLFAVAQALAHADIVAAVLPLSFARTLRENPELSPRLRMVAEMPAGCFRAEGADVRVAVAIWDRFESGEGVLELKVKSLDAQAPSLTLDCRTDVNLRASAIRLSYAENVEQSITLPATGDRTVRVCHHGRRVILKFFCGLTEAKVRNAIS
jgi:hypothetical protein